MCLLFRKSQRPGPGSRLQILALGLGSGPQVTSPGSWPWALGVPCELFPMVSGTSCELCPVVLGATSELLAPSLKPPPCIQNITSSNGAPVSLKFLSEGEGRQIFTNKQSSEKLVVSFMFRRGCQHTGPY